MWKLIIAVVALSDTGTPSVSTSTTTIADQATCTALATEFSREGEKEYQGHKFLIKGTGKCVPDGSCRAPWKIAPLASRGIAPSLDN